MTLKECYQKLGGNYEDILSRLGDEETIIYFIQMFLQDVSFAHMSEALQQTDARAAYSQVHTFKGVCVNLSFDRLAAAARCVCEHLLEGDMETARALLPELTAEYEHTRTMIQEVAKEL